MTILPISLIMAAAAALINFWLANRIGDVRRREKISVGDGGSEPLIRRMRAQANFVEITPFVLILIVLVELAIGSATWLWIVGGVYMLGRILHARGMDGWGVGRMIGTILSLLILVGLAVYAATIPYFAFDEPVITEVPIGG